MFKEFEKKRNTLEDGHLRGESDRIIKRMVFADCRNLIHVKKKVYLHFQS